ncbi:MAG: DDE-type integrase/transposase/recombinase [Myxococcales bacterium]|nr:DDE-type integrase/transposase/recombinase [Myxococcales bacterium]
MTRSKRTKGPRARAGKSLRGRRFTTAQKQEAMDLIRTGLKRTEVARRIGTTIESLRVWRKSAAVKSAKTGARRSGPGKAQTATAAAEAPAPDAAPVLSPGGLAPIEVEAILQTKKEHPSMGPAQIRAQLKRFRGWRISIKAVQRVLEKAGYRMVHTKSRPEGQEDFKRFEVPRRNAIWQIDFADLRVGPERAHVLLIVDDYSRFIVGHALGEEPSSEVAVGTLERAIAQHGKCEAVYTDRGGAFLAWREQSGFQRYLERELIDHSVSRPSKPQGRGKVEALIGTLQRELWQVRHFESLEHARRELAAWVTHYNERRAHMGIDGLCPADRYHGRAEAVSAELAARARDRAKATAANEPTGAPVQETADAPIEVLRLVMVGDKVELRVFGGRVELGTLKR